MYLDAFPVDLEKSLAEIRLAHDVSGEKRDSSGKWTSGGGSEKKEKVKKRKVKKPKTYKGQITKGAVVGGAMATGYAGLLHIGFKAIHKDPAMLAQLRQSGINTAAMPKGLKGKHFAAIAALGALVGGSHKAYQHKKATDEKFRKKAEKAEIAANVAYWGHLGIKKYQYRHAGKLHDAMLKDISGVKGATASNPVIRGMVRSKAENKVYAYLRGVQQGTIPRSKKLDKLANKLRVEQQFHEAPTRTKIKIAKEIRSRQGIKTVGEHIKNIASKVIRKLKPLKTVAVKQISHIKLSHEDCDIVVKKLRKNRHKLPELIAGMPL